MNRIGSEGAHRAPAGESVQDVHSDLTDMTQDASSGLHDTAEAVAEPALARSGAFGGVSASLMLVVLTLALVVASAGCLAVVGLGLALWLPLLIGAAVDGAPPARGLELALTLAAPLVVFGFVWAAWRAFAKARASRCAELMIAALIGALGLHALLLGF